MNLKAVILHFTHPFATENNKIQVYFPFDLHVLSILLAFILSQNQTQFLIKLFFLLKILYYFFIKIIF